MRRLVILSLAVCFSAAACADDATVDETTAQPQRVAIEIDMAVTQTEDRTWDWHSSGWWDGEISAAVLTEDGEPIWHERDGLVTRLGVIVPDLLTPWSQFDLATWGTIDRADRDFFELGSVVEVWGVPTIESLISLRDLVAAQGPADGTATTVIDGAEFLGAVDVFVANRSLVDCAGSTEIETTVVDGVITEMSLDIDTGTHLRSVTVTFAPWEGELPPPPDEAEITRARHHRRDAPRPARPALVACDHEVQQAVDFDRDACPAPTSRHSGFFFTVIERHAEFTPAAPARLWLSLARPFDFDELRERIADQGLAVTGLAAQAPIPAGGVMNMHGIEVDETPGTQEEFDALLTAEMPRPFVEGAAVISSIAVNGTWGDIARLASDCAIHDAGHGNGIPAQADLIDD